MALQEEFEMQGSVLFRYRGIIPIAILLLGIAAYIIHIDNSLKAGYNDLNGLYPFFCLFLSLLGLGIRIYTVGYSPENTSGRNTREQLADKLSVTGIYSVVRHPLYLGNFFMWSGFAILSQNAWFILAYVFMYWVYYERIMFAEEQFLRRKFGEDYLMWAGHTPAFIPGIFKFKMPVTKFHINKVIRKEKTGFFLLFLLYYLFYEIGLSITLNRIAVRFNFWFYAMILSLMFYVLIKVFMNKNRNTVNEPPAHHSVQIIS